MKKILLMFISGIGILTAGYLLMQLLAWGTNLPTFRLSKFMAFYVPLLIFLVVLLTRRDPLGFLLLILVFLLPVLGFKVPPARLGITALDIVNVTVFVLVLYRKYVKRSPIDFLPSLTPLAPVIALIPSVVFSIKPDTSLVCFARLITFYVLFMALFHYFQDPSWRRRFIQGIAISLLLVSISVIAEKTFGINLSLGYHPGKITESGLLIIRRYSGFFQDPQKAAQFMSCLSAFLAILVCRRVVGRSFSGLVCGTAVALSIPAILITASRASILAGLPVVMGAIVFFNRLSLAPRIVLSSVLAALVILFAAIAPLAVVSEGLAPLTVRARLDKSGEALRGRMKIWTETWHIFTERPITGIGLGTYQEYLMRENPRLRSFHEQGGYVPNMPESGYLKILYEGGLVGALGCVVLLGGAIFLVGRSIRRYGNTPVADVVWAALFGLLVFLATFTTIFTISDPRNAMIPIILLLPIIQHGTRKSGPEVPLQEGVKG